MYVAIPTKMSVSEFMSYLKGKARWCFLSGIQNVEPNGETDIFWAWEYCISTVGNVNEETIIKYIQEQEENDKLEDGRK